jgi:hypothetical protein
VRQPARHQLRHARGRDQNVRALLRRGVHRARQRRVRRGQGEAGEGRADVSGDVPIQIKYLRLLPKKYKKKKYKKKEVYR